MEHLALHVFLEEELAILITHNFRCNNVLWISGAPEDGVNGEDDEMKDA